LNEAECYTRLYGDRESTVTVIRDEQEAAPRTADLLGEHLRRLFEERVDRIDELPDAEAA
jgi:hypothetical protein